MRRTHLPFRIRRDGMTLVEIIVAIVIAGVVGTMMFHMIVFTGRTNKAQTSEMVRSVQARTLLERICSDLERVPFPVVANGIGITGKNNKIGDIDADTVQLVRAEFVGEGADLSVKFSEVCYLVEKVVKDKRDLTVLKVRQDDIVDGTVTGDERELSLETTTQQVHLNLRYRADQNLGNPDGWRDEWSASDPLPRAIEVTLQIEDLASDSPKSKPKMITLTRVVMPKASYAF